MDTALDAPIWMTPAQAAAYAGLNPKTITNACREKRLHGGQRRNRGQWRIHRDCLDAWMAEIPCPHNKTG